MLMLLMTLLITANNLKDDLKDMEGTWVLVSTTDGLPGQKKTQQTDRSFKLVVRDNTCQGFQGKKTGKESTFTLDSTKNPKQIDTFHPDAGHLKGIYELDGDTMKSCFSPPEKERPTSFAEAKSTIAVYEREKPRP